MNTVRTCFCEQAGADAGKYQRRMPQRLGDGVRAAVDAAMMRYYYKPSKCKATQVLVDVSAVEVRRLMEVHPSVIKLPSGYCFDLTPSDELVVARTCRPVLRPGQLHVRQQVLQTRRRWLEVQAEREAVHDVLL
ncbi:uncharacterized protein LOC132934742 [Metopolophium dirhodum]|uniref:uncharacterized protein LOC132934742 n=1 Tax=Metopolophium dirhodum TaxID=44670 RepID=UPI00298FA776|nr:uncharacterized protein LOC132934742 [Metopolophium dirhodum]